MAIDKGDWHYDDAKSWNRSCRHIGLYLAWAAQRGLASDEHDAAAAARAPTSYFIKQCDTKLWDVDFNAEGLRFTKAAYDDYCAEVSAYARRLGVGDYEIPEGAKTTKHFFAWIDARLGEWRRARTKTTTTKKTRTKIKTKPRTRPKPKTKSKRTAKRR